MNSWGVPSSHRTPRCAKRLHVQSLGAHGTRRSSISFRDAGRIPASSDDDIGVLMTRNVIAALRLSLQDHLSLRKSRLESFCVLVVGVLLSRTVNLSHLACMFPTAAEVASNYRRLQRFFEQVILDGHQLARVMVRIAGLGVGPWLLALDRTCWTFGRHNVNVLMLAIIRNGIAIPVMWDVLGRAGNSTTAQRSALLSRFCAVFGETAIAGSPVLILGF